MTMYNEDDDLLTRSMHGIIKNVAHLCKRDRSKTWGKEGWMKVLVCVSSDSRAKVNSRISVLVSKWVLPGRCRKDNDRQADEYTNKISVTPSLNIETESDFLAISDSDEHKTTRLERTLAEIGVFARSYYNRQ